MDPNTVTQISTNAPLVSSLIDLACSLMIAGATVFAALAALWGVKTWRKEFRGKRQIELAEEVLELFYKARDDMRDIRLPYSWEEDWAGREALEGETRKEKAERNQAYAAFARYDRQNETFNRLHSIRYRFMVQINKDEAKPFEEIHDIVSDLMVTSLMLRELWHKLRFAQEDEREELKCQEREYMKVLVCGPEKEDPIVDRLDGAVKSIESTCKKVIVTGTLSA